MRLFIAVDLDDNARAAIATEQTRIAAVLAGSRSTVTWVKPDRMHLTLVFLGEVDDTRVAAVVASISRDLDAAPFEIVLEQIGTFPAHGAPRAVWIGVGDGADRLTGLQLEMARRVRALDLAVEPRPFHPHLTLGRWRSARSSDRRKVVSAAKPGRIARLPVDGATLYHSRLSSSGPAYTPLARATLLRV